MICVKRLSYAALNWQLYMIFYFICTRSCHCYCHLFCSSVPYGEQTLPHVAEPETPSSRFMVGVVKVPIRIPILVANSLSADKYLATTHRPIEFLYTRWYKQCYQLLVENLSWQFELATEQVLGNMLATEE